MLVPARTCHTESHDDHAIRRDVVRDGRIDGMVGAERLELSRVLPQRILSPPCLPVPASAPCNQELRDFAASNRHADSEKSVLPAAYVRPARGGASRMDFCPARLPQCTTPPAPVATGTR